MAAEWDEDAGLPAAANTAPFIDEGRSYGRGRGIKPLSNNNSENCGVGSNNDHYRVGNGNSNGKNSSSVGGWENSGGWGDGRGWNSGGCRGGSDNRDRGRGGGRGAFHDRNGEDQENNSSGGRYNGNRDDDDNDNKDRNGYRDNRGGRNGGYQPRGDFRGGRGAGREAPKNRYEDENVASSGYGSKFNGDNRENNYRGGRGNRYNDRNGGDDRQSRARSNRDNSQGEDRISYRNRDKSQGDNRRGSRNRDKSQGDDLRGYRNRDQSQGDDLRGYRNRDKSQGDDLRGYRNRDKSQGDDLRGYRNRDKSQGDDRRGYRNRDKSQIDDRRGYRNRDKSQGDDRRGYRNRDDDGAEGSSNSGDNRAANKFDGDDKSFRGRNDGPDPDRPPPVTYIPPEISTDDNELFSGVGAGLNFSKYDEIKVTVTGKNAPEPIETFEAMGLRNFVHENIVKSGYTKPTPVQKYAIPIIMAGRDLMACAQTGSGKTAAFMVPIINTLLERPKDLKLISGGCEPHCIVVSPTRELAVQIWQQALKFAKGSMIKCCVIYGGVSTMHHGNLVACGCHILVATPGRLLDFVDRRRVSFASVRFVVLDEADRMLDAKSLEDMQRMMDHETMVPKEERQTLMFSATFGKQVQNIARDFFHEHLKLTVGIIGGACVDIEQIFYQVTKSEKRQKLLELVRSENVDSIPKTMIFVETKRTADFIAATLSEDNIPATSIHGDRMQQQREEALRDFRTGRMPILVATAVGARGLDIKGVAHVINYDMPKDPDQYVHRIGRTGRVGNCGKATSLFNFETDYGIVDDLVKILTDSGQNVPDWLSGGGKSNFAPGRNYGNDGTYDGASNYPNTTCNAEPDELW